MDKVSQLDRGPLERFITHERVAMEFDLHPSTSGSFSSGVEEELRKMVLTYREPQRGVVLSFSRVKMAGGVGRIHTYFPYIRVPASAKLEIFKPQIGALMSGTVSKVGADYLSLLCGGVFNVAIGRQDIRKEFQPKSDTAWATKSGERVEQGTLLRFVLKDVIVAAGIFTMVGSLLEKETGLGGERKEKKERGSKGGEEGSSRAGKEKKRAREDGSGEKEREPKKAKEAKEGKAKDRDKDRDKKKKGEKGRTS